MATSNTGDASSVVGSHDSRTASHDPQLYTNKAAGLLRQVCKDLSERSNHDVIRTALETDTQEMEIKNRDSPENERELTELREEVRTLKELYDGVVRINQQWALDYDKLQQQIDDTQLTGFVTPSSSRSHGDILMSPSSERCFECYITKSRLQDSASEVERVKKECEAVKRELGQVKGQQEVLKRERDQAVSENRAIQFQLQELGDLRQAMHLKEEYPKKLQELKSIKRQLQEEVCTRIKLDKQIERLRKVFTDLFPATPTKPESGRGLSTYPPHLRPCHAQQQFYSDPGPPTPPGLIARGHLTSLVERDTQSLSQQSEEQVIGFERPLVRLHSPTGRAQERWASDPHLNVERGQLINGHTHSSLAPPTVVPLKTRSMRSNRRPRSLFDERGDIARSLVDVRYPSDTTNQISPPEARSGDVKCPSCGDRFRQSQIDIMFDHFKMCGT